MGMLAVLLTATYSHRLLQSVFIASYPEIRPFTTARVMIVKNWEYNDENNKWIYEGLDIRLFIPLFTLLVCSIVVGFLLSDLFIGFGTNTWALTFTVLPINYSLINIELVSPLIKNLPIIFSLICMFVTCIILNILDIFIITDIICINRYYYNKFQNILLPFSSFSYHAGFFNLIYNNIFILFINKMYLTYVKSLDRGIFEFFGPFGVFLFFRNLHYYYKNLWFMVLSLTLYIIFIVVFLFIGVFLLFNLSNILLLFPLLLVNSSFLILLILVCDYYIIKNNI